jgi:hypothetical protein
MQSAKNIRVFRESPILILAHFFAVPLLPNKRQILHPSADPWHIGSNAQVDGGLNGFRPKVAVRWLFICQQHR